MNPTSHHCAACSTELVEISLLVDGQELMMRSCSVCDTRSWHRDGERLGIDEVLADISGTRTRYRRDLSLRAD